MKALCGCYRKDEAADPEIYSAAIEAILDEYEDDIVRIVTDPRTGLPSKHQWLPTVKEVRDACEDAHQTLISAERRKCDLERQFAERESYDAEQAAKAARPTTAEIEAKLGRSINPRKSIVPTDGDKSKADGKHAERVAKDLAERAARRAVEATA